MSKRNTKPIVDLAMKMFRSRLDLFVVREWVWELQDLDPDVYSEMVKHFTEEESMHYNRWYGR